MKVICINEYKLNKITVGKIYETIEEKLNTNIGFNYYLILNDVGRITYVNRDNFLTISENRNKKLNEILNGDM